MAKQFRYMVIGAHQDDCEMVGGIAVKLVRLGHKVKFLTATNGFSGHQEHMGGEIVKIREQEAKNAAEPYGIECGMLDNNDAFLTTDLATRQGMLKAIREWAPDVIITHRPNDYHPDHRNTSILVQDCSYLVQVPNVAPLTPVLRYQPAIFYAPDNFQKPYPFTPTLVFDITDTFEDKMRMYHAHKSQMYDWLPWVAGNRDEVPESDEDRFQWLINGPRAQRLAHFADLWRDQLVEKYGDSGRDTIRVEGLELCEYGGQPDAARLKELFPF